MVKVCCRLGPESISKSNGPKVQTIGPGGSGGRSPTWKKPRAGDCQCSNKIRAHRVPTVGIGALIGDRIKSVGKDLYRVEGSARAILPLI